MLARWTLVAGMMAVVLAACGEDGPRIDGENRVPAELAGPTVTALDTVALQEPVSQPMGQFIDGTRAADGTVFVSDGASGRVLRFRPDGSFDGTIGAPGSGPGELRRPGRVVLVESDSVLAVEHGGSGIQLFGARAGAFLSAIRGTVQHPGHTWSAVEGGYVFGSHFAAYPVVRWDVASNTVVSIGNVPDASLAAGASYLTLGRVEVIPDGDGFIVLFPGEPGVQKLDRTGVLLSRVPVPAARRRGNPPDLLARQVAHDARGGLPEFLGSSSVGLARLSTGEIAVLHADVTAPVPPADAGGIAYWVSILSQDLRRVCVDAAVPFPTDAPLPYLWFQGDTLVGLSRHLDGSGVRTVVRRFAVSSQGCGWVGR